MEQVDIFKALSNATRLQLLEWLKNPEVNFPDQHDSGFEHGVCVGQLQTKAGLTQSTISDYLAILQRAGLITSKRVGQWTYYKRDEEAIAALVQTLASKL